ncbi:MAG: 4-hydroxythreonine-4-phosphate dehydrogenase PdxA [Ignisphaera sp.]
MSYPKNYRAGVRVSKEIFGICDPGIAAAGLNPHAGESGIFGDEEIKKIAPAISEAQNKGIEVLGLFHQIQFYRAYHNKEFNAVIVMYHDQGHIVVKMVGFAERVNITLGLPIIRTFPDHGTA